MTEGRRTNERPSASLVAAVLNQFGARIDPDEPGWTGEESVGWRAETADGASFVQRLPRWRSLEELAWCDRVARAAGSRAPEAVCARTADGDAIAIETDEGLVCVFPFIEGAHPTTGTEIAGKASELLARLHQGLVGTWMTGVPRPPGLMARAPIEGDVPAILIDPELDAWEREMTTGSAPQNVIHGDFYPGNLIVRGGMIVGVIDWLEARVEHQAQEVSWAAWEFCQNESGDDLVNEAARAFLTTYVEAGGPAEIGPGIDPIPWIRQRLRREAAPALREAGSRPLESEYHIGQIRAFHALRGRHLWR